jgi:pimeloyl-ACP methyl ester carboxylesterase
MRRVLASNPDHNPFYAGFLACDRYDGGAKAIGRVHCPILFVLGDEDQMTPAKGAKGLIDQAKSVQVLRLPVGHQMMSEAPDRVLEGLRVFVK